MERRNPARWNIFVRREIVFLLPWLTAVEYKLIVSKWKSNRIDRIKRNFWMLKIHFFSRFCRVPQCTALRMSDESTSGARLGLAIIHVISNFLSISSIEMIDISPQGRLKPQIGSDKCIQTCESDCCYSNTISPLENLGHFSLFDICWYETKSKPRRSIYFRLLISVVI